MVHDVNVFNIFFFITHTPGNYAITFVIGKGFQPSLIFVDMIKVPSGRLPPYSKTLDLDWIAYQGEKHGGVTFDRSDICTNVICAK
jgi:hypothetical protein